MVLVLALATAFVACDDELPAFTSVTTSRVIEPGPELALESCEIS
jgi:hypothetical protein